MRAVICFCAAMALCRPGLAAGDWAEIGAAGPFRYRAEIPLADRPGLTRELEQLTADVEQTLHLETTGKPIQLNLFRSKASYADYLERRIPDGAPRQALFIKGPDMGRVYVYHHRTVEADLRHECTHALLHNALPFLPLWLDEGLAVYFEAPPENRIFAHPHLKRVRWELRFGRQPTTLRVLEKKSRLEDFQGRDYRDAWAWVHFLLHESPQSRKVLVDYLLEIQNDHAPGAFSDWMNFRLQNAEVRMVRHLKEWSE